MPEKILQKPDGTFVLLAVPKVGINHAISCAETHAAHKVHYNGTWPQGVPPKTEESSIWSLWH